MYPQLSGSENPEMKELHEIKKFRKLIFQEHAGELNEKEILGVIQKVRNMDQEIGKQGHKYIEALETYVIKPIGLEIEEVAFWDTFCFRINKQSDLKTLLKNNEKLKWQQLLITLKMIEWHNPKMLVLPNSTAGQHFRDAVILDGGRFGFSKEYNHVYPNQSRARMSHFLVSKPEFDRATRYLFEGQINE
ncbi:hypothetical protein B2I21_27995 [Chryseobacterium mucoviscidosis]|nr:hypothetical protein B2I21_27995 [Chryseobacterium mucoviscidosis]